MCQHPGKPFLALGGVTIVASILSVVFQAGAMGSEKGGYREPFTHISTGIWCGIISLIPGILCILIGKRIHLPHKPVSLLGATLGMSIVSLLFSIVLLSLSIILTIVQPICFSEYQSSQCSSAVMGLGIALIVVSLIQICTSIAILAYSSYHICCRRQQGHTGVSASYSAVPVQGMIGAPVQFGYLVQGPDQSMYVVPSGSIPPRFTQVNVQQVGSGQQPDNQEDQKVAVMANSPPAYTEIISGMNSAVTTHSK